MQTLSDSIEDRASRWMLLAEFAHTFLRAFTPRDVVSKDEIVCSERSLGQQLPESLAEFYRLCGNAKDVWCCQDDWFKPAELRQTDEVLVFWVENQGNWSLGIRLADLSLEDPPVVWDAASWLYDVGRDGEYTVLTESVSKFALNMIAYVAKFFDPGRERPIGYTHDVARMLDTLRSRYDMCQLQKEWVYGPESYFQDSDTFVEVNEGDGFIYPIFRTAAALDRFCSLPNDTRFEWQVAPDRGS